MKKVREGYKITEFGEIPSEWEVKKLKDLGNSVIGLTYSPDDLVDGCNGTLVLRSSNIRNNRIVFDDNKYVNKDIQEKLIVKENDILICSRNGSKELIGKCALIDKKAEGSSFGAFMTVYRSKYNKYLFNVFTSYMFKRQIYNNLGATINQITTDNLNNFKIIVPTIKEQEKIASILSTVDEQIDNVDALIEKNKELKKGLMQTLLTKGIGHTKFKKTEIGEIPEEWEVRRLEDICDDITIGMVKTMTKFYVDNGVPLIRNSDIKENTIKTDSMVYLDKEFSRANQSKCLNIGQIVTVHTGDIGTSAVIEENMQGAQGFATLNTTVNKSIINEYYLCWYLNSDICKNQAYSFSTGDGRNNLNLKDFVNILAIVPSSIEEQKKIVFILNSISRKIQEYENKKQKLEELKKGLMQQLLSGRIRVK